MSGSGRKAIGLVVGAAVVAGVMFAVVGRRKSPPPPPKEEEVIAEAPATNAPPAPPPRPSVAPPPAPSTTATPTPQVVDAGIAPTPTPPSQPLNPAGRPTALSATEYAAEQMQTLRQLVDTEPQRAVDMARQANRRFPRSPDVPERSWIVVKGLVNLKRFEEARDEARALVAKYPDNQFARDAERHLLVYPLGQPSREQMQQQEAEKPR